MQTQVQYIYIYTYIFQIIYIIRYPHTHMGAKYLSFANQNADLLYIDVLECADKLKVLFGN